MNANISIKALEESTQAAEIKNGEIVQQLHNEREASASQMEILQVNFNTTHLISDCPSLAPLI